MLDLPSFPPLDSVGNSKNTAKVYGSSSTRSPRDETDQFAAETTTGDVPRCRTLWGSMV
jgi:hypothetical protein